MRGFGTTSCSATPVDRAPGLRYWCDHIPSICWRIPGVPGGAANMAGNVGLHVLRLAGQKVRIRAAAATPTLVMLYLVFLAAFGLLTLLLAERCFRFATLPISCLTACSTTASVMPLRTAFLTAFSTALMAFFVLLFLGTIIPRQLLHTVKGASVCLTVFRRADLLDTLHERIRPFVEGCFVDVLRALGAQSLYLLLIHDVEASHAEN